MEKLAKVMNVQKFSGTVPAPTQAGPQHMEEAVLASDIGPYYKPALIQVVKLTHRECSQRLRWRACLLALPWQQCSASGNSWERANRRGLGGNSPLPTEFHYTWKPDGRREGKRPLTPMRRFGSLQRFLAFILEKSQSRGLYRKL